MNIRDDLFKLEDKKYKSFIQKLIPNLDPELFIGIPTPALRTYAKSLKNQHPEASQQFIRHLPHQYYEENNLHAFLIALEQDYETCMKLTEDFLPYIDNWATCDSFSPKIFKKQPEALYEKILTWIHSDHPYTQRFGIGMLMQHFLDQHFDPKHLQMVSSLRSDEYYVKMMIAWYFSMALVQQYQATLPFLEGSFMDAWTHNKSIQKALESRQIRQEQKTLLKRLKRKV